MGKFAKILTYLSILAVLLVVCMTLFSSIALAPKLIIRISLLLIFFACWRIFTIKRFTIFRDISFALMAVNLAFLIVMPFTTSFWSLESDTPRGIAMIKLSDSLIVSTVIILTFLFAGYRLKSIYLSKGKLILGLIVGILFFLLFGFLAINNPQHKPYQDLIQKNIHWILVFVLANGFMEELIFRAVFLEKLNSLFKPAWSIILTSICFAAPHLMVRYQSDVLLFAGICFVLGMICGYAMHYTRSIIAPWLIHAGADLMIMIPVFVSYGVSG